VLAPATVAALPSTPARFPDRGVFYAWHAVALGEGGSLFPFAPLLGLEKRAKVGLMGHYKGRDNARKRAKHRKKNERLALAKQPSRDATARQGKKAGK
jgi:hypothetical protein